MTRRAIPAGAAPMGRLADLEPWEADLVLNCRLWRAGPQGQAQVWEDYARAFGAELGRDELRRFEALLSALFMHGTRRFAVHAVTCSCVGADEMALLRMARLGLEGELREAAIMAALVVLPSRAEQVALQAAHVGSVLKTDPQPARRVRSAPTAHALRLH